MLLFIINCVLKITFAYNVVQMQVEENVNDNLYCK